MHNAAVAARQVPGKFHDGDHDKTRPLERQLWVALVIDEAKKYSLEAETLMTTEIGFACSFNC